MTKGLVFPSYDDMDKLILRQAVKIEEIKEPVKPIEHLITKVDK